MGMHSPSLDPSLIEYQHEVISAPVTAKAICWTYIFVSSSALTRCFHVVIGHHPVKAFFMCEEKDEAMWTVTYDDPRNQIDSGYCVEKILRSEFFSVRCVVLSQYT